MRDDDYNDASWAQHENELHRQWINSYNAEEKTMDVSGFLTSNGALLKKEDIGKNRPVVTIAGVDITEFDGDKKLVLKFEGKEKGMALNKTNLLIVSEAFGSESDHWVGQKVELWVDPYVTFGGKVVGGLKLTPMATAPVPPPQAPNEADNSEIPF